MNLNTGISLDAMDIVFSVFLILGIAAGVFYFLYKLFISKKQRREVSFQGERVAENAVRNSIFNSNDIDYFQSQTPRKPLFPKLGSSSNLMNTENIPQVSSGGSSSRKNSYDRGITLNTIVATMIGENEIESSHDLQVPLTSDLPDDDIEM